MFYIVWVDVTVLLPAVLRMLNASERRVDAWQPETADAARRHYTVLCRECISVSGITTSPLISHLNYSNDRRPSRPTLFCRRRKLFHPLD